MENKIKFGLLQFSSYIGFGMCMANLIPYMNYLKFDVFERGLAMSAFAVLNVVFQIVFGILSDKFQTVKWVTIGSTLFYGIATALFFQTEIHKLLYLVIIVAISGGLLNSLCGLQDTWILNAGDFYRELFSKLKAFGSVGWAIGSLLSSFIVIRFSYKGLGLISILITMIVVWVSLSLPDIEKEQESFPITFKEFLQLFTINRYVLLLVALFLLYSLIVANSILVIDKMIALNATSLEISLKWMIGSLIEIPMYLTNMYFIRRFGNIKLLKFSSVIIFIQFILFSMAISGWQVIVICMLQLFTTPIILVTSKLLIAEIIPSRFMNSGQLVAMSLYIGGSSLIIPILSGWLVKRISYNMTLVFFSVFALVALRIIKNLEKQIS